MPTPQSQAAVEAQPLTDEQIDLARELSGLPRYIAMSNSDAVYDLMPGLCRMVEHLRALATHPAPSASAPAQPEQKPAQAETRYRWNEPGIQTVHAVLCTSPFTGDYQQGKLAEEVIDALAAQGWKAPAPSGAAPAQPVAPAEPEYETRDDGKRVRVDRWQLGIRRIVALLWGNRHEFEVDDVVEAVRKLVPAPFSEGDDEGFFRSVVCERALATHPPAVQPAAPAGWVMVPREPTPEMVKAGAECWYASKDNAAGYWREMIAAAPPASAPSAAEPVAAEQRRQAAAVLRLHQERRPVAPPDAGVRHAALHQGPRMTTDCSTVLEARKTKDHPQPIRYLVSDELAEDLGQAPTLTDRLQRRCYDWGTYWRAPDAHGVVLTVEQAAELLRDALGVEVEVQAAQPAAELGAPWTPMELGAPPPDSDCAVLVSYTEGRRHLAIDRWEMQREDPTGMGGPTMEMGYGWSDNYESDVLAWMVLPSVPDIEDPRATPPAAPAGAQEPQP